MPRVTILRTDGCGVGCFGGTASPSLAFPLSRRAALFQFTSFRAPPMNALANHPPALWHTRSTCVAPGCAASASRTVASSRSMYHVYAGSLVDFCVQNPTESRPPRIFAQSLRSTSTTKTSKPLALSDAARLLFGSPKGAR